MLRDISVRVGFVFAVAGLVGSIAGLAACSAAPQLAGDIACRLDALRVLPEDPEQVTVYDAIDVVNRVRACRGGDAGR